jgi:hypothetical protein
MKYGRHENIRVEKFRIRVAQMSESQSVGTTFGCQIESGTMQILQIVTSVTLATMMVGCAKSPDSIAPAYVSEVNFQNWDCRQLGEESTRLSQALAQASTQQENARTNDTVGIILIGLPVSSLSGDNIAPEIARLKGETEAVRKVSINKGCATATSTPTSNIITSSTR